MNTYLHTALLILLLIVASLALADPPAGYRLSPTEKAELKEPLALARRIIAARYRYSKASERVRVPAEYDVMTRTPTIEVIHAAGYISDSDALLSYRYRVVLQLVAPGAALGQAVLTMQTNRGELMLDKLGNAALARQKH